MCATESCIEYDRSGSINNAQADHNSSQKIAITCSIDLREQNERSRSSTCLPIPHRGRDPSQRCARAKAAAKGSKEVAKEKWPTTHRPTNYFKYPFPTSGPYWSFKRNHKALVLHKSRTQGTNTRRKRYGDKTMARMGQTKPRIGD
ncbi:uncharacterized protein [Drosophila kikkawai]|uniref:Uncharacterized protein n=1 Tax=Drosophila kikkawai TaxID=30033 RepID=A0ABM4GLB2_DROKI